MTIAAVLLDVGGVFHLPDHDIMKGALALAGFDVDINVLDRAHYTGATELTTDYPGDIPWGEMWPRYVRTYAIIAGVPDDLLDDAVDHLSATFSTAGPWVRIVPGCREGLADLASTGVRLGVVSNADGTTAERLAAAELLQVGPGLGIAIETLIDSGVVGVMKPDPAIFRIALDALKIEPDDCIYVGDMPGIDVVGARRAGIRPVVMDPYELQLDADYERVASLSELAEHVRAGVYA